MTTTRKINVTLTIEYDPEAWETIYGFEPGTEQRADIKQYVLGSIQDSAAADEGGIVAVTLR